MGFGWQGFTQLVAPGDFSGDGRADVIASSPDGRLWLYPGDGFGGFQSQVLLGQGWDVFNTLAPAGSFGGGSAGLLARAGDGTLYVYPGNGKGGFLPRAAVGSGWNSAGDLIGGEDLTRDKSDDVLAAAAGGAMTIYPGDGSGFADRLAIGTGWTAFDQVWEAGDFNGDRVADVLARSKDGALWLYPGNGSGAFLPRVQVGSGWNMFNTILSAGDFDGDSRPDLVGRAPDGTLWLYPTDGKGSSLPVGRSGWAGRVSRSCWRRATSPVTVKPTSLGRLRTACCGSIRVTAPVVSLRGSRSAPDGTCSTWSSRQGTSTATAAKTCWAVLPTGVVALPGQRFGWLPFPNEPGIRLEHVLQHRRSGQWLHGYRQPVGGWSSRRRNFAPVRRDRWG